MLEHNLNNITMKYPYHVNQVNIMNNIFIDVLIMVIDSYKWPMFGLQLSYIWPIFPESKLPIFEMLKLAGVYVTFSEG